MNALELCIEHYRNGKEIWKSTESVVTSCHIEALREAFDTNYNFVNWPESVGHHKNHVDCEYLAFLG